ncbi:MAG: hypothetical protein PVG39_06040 [Desulfobacteraceae bacterium]|jgi:hypothetical protein
MKKIWITSIGSSEEMVKKLLSQLKTYGLEGGGHFWQDDLKKFAWIGARDELIDKQTAMWIILGSKEELFSPDVLYGLSLLTITVKAQRGLNLPVIILQTDGDPIDPEQLSMPLKDADIMPVSISGLGAKLVAKAHSTPSPVSSEYYMDILGNDQIGQWFEIRPTKETWSGVMFGVTGAEILFQAVGPSGSLPDKTVLNYPMQGLKLDMGGKEYTAWATQNELNHETSYFVKVEGFPESIIFGSYSTEEKTDVFVFRLK